jgi:hypothetical protein
MPGLIFVCYRHEVSDGKLIAISIGQQDMKSDMRAMADDIKSMKAGQEAITQRQSDLEARMTNLSGTVQRSLANQHAASTARLK